MRGTNVQYYACNDKSKRKFGKISFGENITFVHALESVNPPKDAILISVSKYRFHYYLM